MVSPLTKSNRLRRYAIGIAVGFTGLVLVYVAISVWRYTHRPMFFNTFTRHPDRGLMPRWWAFPFPPVDRAGNLVLMDSRRNLIVVVPTGEAECQGQRMPVETRGGVVLELSTTPPRSISVPCDANRLFILDTSGKVVSTTVLGKQMAEQLFDLVDNDTPDASRLLREKATQPMKNQSN